MAPDKLRMRPTTHSAQPMMPRMKPTLPRLPLVASPWDAAFFEFWPRMIAGIPAIILGQNSKKAASQGLATNGNLGNVGFILGIIGCALWVVGLILNLSGAIHYNFSN